MRTERHNKKDAARDAAAMAARYTPAEMQAMHRTRPEGLLGFRKASAPETEPTQDESEPSAKSRRR